MSSMGLIINRNSRPAQLRLTDSELPRLGPGGTYAYAYGLIHVRYHHDPSGFDLCQVDG
jgi:hypothetical protein